MHFVQMTRIYFIVIFGIFSFSLSSEAKETKYFFNGNEFVKLEQKDGNSASTSYCKDKFGVGEFGVSPEEVAATGDNIYVSPNEKYFVFIGTAHRQDEARYFLANIAECKVIRELLLGKEYESVSYAAAFSPDSKKLYISWYVTGNNSIDQQSKAFWLTKEYGGEGFADEKKLMNVVIPGRILSGDEFRYPYKFSKDENAIVVAKNLKDWDLSVYDLQKDEVSFRAIKLEDYFGHKKYSKGDYVPDISDGRLLFNFETDRGVEMNVFNFRDKKIENKIEVPEKGLGRFSSKGDSVIVSTFPDPKTMKKKALVYDRKTGKRKGSTMIDASDEVEDVSDDGKQIILKNGKHAAMEHND